MTIILLLMFSGIISGFALGKFPLILKINEKFLNVAIYILLLLLGIAVGTNDKIINNLYHIGLQAVIITIGAIAGSVIICWLIFKSFSHLNSTSTTNNKRKINK